MVPATASAEHKIDVSGDEGCEPAMWLPECCVYEVPEILRMGKPEAYTPQLVSIGPLHHNDEKLKPMEQQKKLHHQHFQERQLDSNPKKALTEFKSFIEREENQIRKCYSKKCDLSKDNFVEMILLDSVFLVELFLRYGKGEEDVLFEKFWIADRIRLDLTLLENQIPMFVLVELYRTVFPHEPKDSFLKLACTYFVDLFCLFQPVEGDGVRLNKFQKAKHFADMIRYSSSPTGWELKDLNPWDPFQNVELKNGATALDAAGITFEKLENQPLLAVEFKKSSFKSRLRIPQLIVDDGTEVLLWNLVALEQCHYPLAPYICSYLDLMDSLIHEKQDVDFLIEN